jgi:hypothetical protein
MLALGSTELAEVNPQVTPACPTSRPQLRSGRLAAIPTPGRTSGRDFGRLSSTSSDPEPVEGRANSSSKLRHPSRRRRGLGIRPDCIRHARTLSGQPAVFAAATRSRIRARELGRHENRNDKNLLPFNPRPHFKQLPPTDMGNKEYPFPIRTPGGHPVKYIRRPDHLSRPQCQSTAAFMPPSP